MKRIKSILRIAARTLGILLITGGISGVPAIVFAADMALAGEPVPEIGADEAAVESDKEETLTLYETAGDDAVFSDINEDASELNPDSALPEDEGDYVVGANTVIDRIGMEGYDAVTDDNMELYTAFEADLNLEIQGGRCFKGHEILNFGDSDIKVYDKENFEALTDGEDSTNAQPKAKPSVFNAPMVFALDEIPVEMSDNYMLFVDYTDYSDNPEGEHVYYLKKVTGTTLYAWEYEKQADGTYKRISSIPISNEDFMVNDDDDTMYVNLGIAHIYTEKKRLEDLSDPDLPNYSYNPDRIYTYLSKQENSGMKKDYYQHVPTLSGLVRLNGAAFKDSSNPIAIVAMCYDATTTDEEALYKIQSGTAEGNTYTYNEYNWGNNVEFTATEAISYDKYYYGQDVDGGVVSHTKYWSDEPYYASKMGSFSLQPYEYRFTDTGTEHILTLYNVSPYSLFVGKTEQGMHVFDNWRAAYDSRENLPIGTWKIPATYTDPLSGTTYNVRIAKGGNIVPQYASKLIVEDGVGFPEDCSYLFSSMGNITLRCLSEIVIQGNPKTVGSNIKNMSYMFLGKKGREGFDATTYDSLDFAALDTSNVTDMSYLFADVTMTSRANIDVTTLDTSKVKSFKGMFRSYHVPGIFISSPATSLDLSLFNTESAEDMSEMFEGSTISSLDLSNFNFSKVTDMSRMCTFTEYLESVTFPSDMDSSKVTDMSFMFAGDYNLSQINNITAMDTGSVTDMSGMFGAHQCNIKNYETIPEPGDMGDAYLGSYQYDKRMRGFSVFSPAWVTAEIFNVYDGPAITSLDLTGFDTGKVKYANGMFYMPNLTRIKWGESTTFEALSDAGGMFTLPSVKKLDLTGRKFSNIKFACSDRFPMEMFNLQKATELVLGEDSIDLSKLSSKGQLMINAPELYSLDLRKVEMGANALAGVGALYYQSPSSLQGLSGLYEIYLPAGMPLLTSPAELPGTFYDGAGNGYTKITGGYENDLHLVNPEREKTFHTLTVSYLYADGRQAEEPYTEAVEAGKDYSVASPVIPGFTPDKARVSGNMGTVDVNLTVIYTADAAEKYAVTVINGYGGGNYEAGAIVAIKANEPSAGKEFREWTSPDGVVFKNAGSTNTSFYMPAMDVTVEAKYKDIIYTVKVYDDGHGTATASPGSGKMGTEVTLKASPQSGYEFKEWQILSGGVSFDKSKASTTFKIKNSNVEVKATFAKKNTPAPVKTSIRNATVNLSKSSLKYNGKEQKPAVKSVKLNGKTLSSKTDYDIKWSNSKSKKLGTYKVTIKGKGNYTGSKTVEYKIVKGENPLTVKILKKTLGVSYSRLKNGNQTISRSKYLKVSKSQGKVTYKKTKGDKKIVIDKKSGNITVKKGLKKGSYEVTVKVMAAGDKNYKAGSKTKSFTVKVK